MARLSILAAVVGALLAVTAAAQAVVDINIPDVCNPTVCMGLAVLHSDCLDGFNPGPVMPEGGPPVTTQLTDCVCANATLHDSYLSCYGFCTIDAATEPFCGKPVIARDEEAASKTEIVAADKAIDFKPGKPRPSLRCISKVPGFCEHFDNRPWIGFCGVPGQACGSSKIIDATEDDPEVAETEHPEVTATATLKEREETDAEPTANGRYHILSGRLRNWTNFCGVPGQACGQKEIATATAVETPTATVEAVDAMVTEAADIDDGDVKKDGKYHVLSGRLRNWTNFCGVPGQFCGEKEVVTASTAETPSATVEAVDAVITDGAELDGADIEKDGKYHVLSGRLRNWTNFCGVPGQACGEKIAEPTAEAGGDFVDVGAGDEELEGKLAGNPDKRQADPTTLRTVKGGPVAPAVSRAIPTPPPA